MVKCLRCSYEILRHTFQNVLTQLNPHLAVIPKEDIVRPDGDVELRLLEIIRLKKLTPTKGGFFSESMMRLLNLQNQKNKYSQKLS